jgi:thiosulfate reductase cytochrome b subunit
MLTGLLSWLLTGQLREQRLPDRYALIVRQRLETLKQVHHSVMWLLMVLLLLFLRLLRSACCVGLQHSFGGSSYSCTILIYVSAIYISCNKLSRLRRIGAGNWLHGESDDWDV